MKTNVPAVRIVEVAFTGYPVTDIERAKAFYEGLLGLEVAVAFEHGGRHWIEYEIGGTTLAISNMSSEQWKASADGPVMSFEVENFEEAVEALRAGGVKFLVEPMATGVCSMAVVSDPDGNSVMIHRRNR